jgi:8-oxo-dGTP diphosphatase
VGILLRADGSFLLTTRPPGKVYAGYWEFPGGKLEAGETVEQALRRELIEELGVTIGAACSPGTVTARLPARAGAAALVQGVGMVGRELQMREGQEWPGSTLPLTVAPVLPGPTQCCSGWPQEQQGLLE